MEKSENIKFGYYVKYGISRGRYLDDQIGRQSGRLDELCIPVIDPKQNRHVGQYLNNDLKEYGEEDYRRRHPLNDVTKGK